MPLQKPTKKPVRAKKPVVKTAKKAKTKKPVAKPKKAHSKPVVNPMEVLDPHPNVVIEESSQTPKTLTLAEAFKMGGIVPNR